MSARFRVRAPARYPASYTRPPTEGSGMITRSCRLSACRHSLVGHPVPAGGLGLPCGRLTGPPSRRPGPRRGYHVSHAQDTTGVGASCTPRPAVFTRPAKSPRSPLAVLPRPGPIPRCSSHHPEAHNNEASTEVQFRSPVRPSPHLHLPDGTGRAWVSSLSFTPRNHLRRTSGRGPATSNTDRKLHSRHHIVGPPTCEFTRNKRPRVAASSWCPR